MEHRTLTTDGVRLVRETSLATYLGLVGSIEGATVTRPHGFTLVRGPGPFSFCNFAAGFDLEEQDVEPAIELLLEQARQSPGFNIFCASGDTPEDLLERLGRAGFVCRLKLVSMVAATASAQDSATPRVVKAHEERVSVAGFMARQFFWRMPRSSREAIAAATAASSHTLWATGTAKNPSAAVMLVETPESVGLYNLCVRPDERGRGLGAGLVGDVLRAALSSGRPVVLQCEPELVGWYERLGFSTVGYVEALSLQNGGDGDILTL